MGFPPRPVTLISELPTSSLGLKRGDALIINELKGTSTSAIPSPMPAALSQANLQSVAQRTTPLPQPAPKVNNSPLFPASATSSTSPATLTTSAKPDEVRTPSGILVHRIVPDDNSCLFSSIGIVFEQDMQAASKLRQGSYTRAILALSC